VPGSARLSLCSDDVYNLNGVGMMVSSGNATAPSDCVGHNAPLASYSRAEARMAFDPLDQSGLCILPRSQPMPSATIAVV
jgi:hypothetical protein